MKLILLFLIFYNPIINGFYMHSIFNQRNVNLPVNTRKSYLFLSDTNTMKTQASGTDLSQRILKNLSIKFPTQNIHRVIESFQRFLKGSDEDLNRYISEDINDIHNKQQASCWVSGIDPIPFHDIQTPSYQWIQDLEANSQIVINEFNEYMQISNKDSKWLIARNIEAAKEYGPTWKTLALQDRGLWDSDNIKLFPKTVQLLRDINVPSCEVFFAKQEVNTGISPHSDLNNFILTSQLALQVDEGKAYIQVGSEREYWKVGKAIVFDTSIYHSTRNDGNIDRYVLLIRFWHPSLTSDEIKAFS